MQKHNKLTSFSVICSSCYWLARVHGEGHTISIKDRKSPKISKRPLDNWHQRKLHVSVCEWSWHRFLRLRDFRSLNTYVEICRLNPNITDRTMLSLRFTHLYPWPILDCHAWCLLCPTVVVDSSIEGRRWAAGAAEAEGEIVAVDTGHCWTLYRWDYLHWLLAYSYSYWIHSGRTD